MQVFFPDVFYNYKSEAKWFFLMRISLFTLDTANVMDLTRNIALGLPLQVLHGEMTDRIQTSTINNPLFFQLQHSQPPKKVKKKSL